MMSPKGDDDDANSIESDKSDDTVDVGIADDGGFTPSIASLFSERACKEMLYSASDVGWF
jgi:hypothetical protein